MAEYDLDHDGTVEETELAAIKGIKEVEMQERKQRSQKEMSWVAIAAMVIFTVVLIIPGVVPVERLKVLAELSALFYISMAGIVGAYMGMTAYMSRK